MPEPHDKHRELIEEPGFAKSKAKIQPDARKLDDAIRGVCWVLARNPEKGKPTGNPRIRPRSRLNRSELQALGELAHLLRQPRKQSRKVGDERGSQSPDASAIAPSERAHAAGVTTVTHDHHG